MYCNRPRSIYQYSNMAPRLSGQNCKFFKLLLSLNSQKRLGYKENNTKYRILTRKPRSHVRILIYRTWPICKNFRVLVYFGEIAWEKRVDYLFITQFTFNFLHSFSNSNQQGFHVHYYVYNCRSNEDNRMSTKREAAFCLKAQIRFQT